MRKECAMYCCIDLTLVNYINVDTVWKQIYLPKRDNACTDLIILVRGIER